MQRRVAEAAERLDEWVRRGKKRTSLQPWPAEEPLNFSFACGGWLKYYEFGVGKAIKQWGLDKNGSRFIGTSAGALTGLGVVLGDDDGFDVAVNFSKTVCMPTCRGTWTGPFRIGEYVADCLELCGNLDRYDQLKDGQLTVCLTALSTLRAIRVSSFRDRDDLKKALLSSSAFFPLAPLVRFRGELCLDGGLTDFAPVFEGQRTITINPFYFSCADIRPSTYVPVWWLVLPPKDPRQIEWVYDLGYRDAVAAFRAMGLLSCRHGGEQCVDPTMCSLRCRKHMGMAATPSAAGEGPLSASSDDNKPWEYGPASAASWGLEHLHGLAALVWRPMAIILIYFELLLRAVLVAGRALVKENAWLLPYFTSVLLAAYFLTPSVVFMCAAFAALGYLLVASFLFASSLRDWHLCVELLATLMSGSLFVRAMVPYWGTSVPLRRHKKLFENSLIYRIHMYMI